MTIAVSVECFWLYFEAFEVAYTEHSSTWHGAEHTALAHPNLELNIQSTRTEYHHVVSRSVIASVLYWLPPT